VCDARFVYPVTEQQDGNGGSRPRPASIRDVARLAGVSHQTVSRVLNGHPSIRDVTKSRVLAAMDQLRFRPSRAARMLSMRRSQTIGILAAAVGSHYGPASSVSAVEDAARDRGYYATVAHLASVAPSAITAAIEELLSQEVEGIVIVAPRTSVLSRLAELPMTVPIVAAQGEPRDAGGIPVATVDQEAGVRLLLDHLIGQGHKRILHVAGPRDWNDAQSRLRAFKAGLRAAGLVWSPPLYGDWTSDSGYAIGRALVQEGSGGGSMGGDGMSGGADAEGKRGRKRRLPFTAVFAANDQMALGVIHAFREAGLDVPRDVSIVGFDDIPESAHFWPPLTTVRQDFGDLGVRCVTMLLDLIQGTGVQGAGVQGTGVRGTGTGNRAGAVHDGPPAAVAPVVQPQLIIRGSVAAI